MITIKIIDKKDYERLQEMAEEINTIMKRNEICDIEIRVNDYNWEEESCNKAYIVTRKDHFDDIKREYKSICNTGQVYFNLIDGNGNNVKYNWDYEDFIEGSLSY